MSLSVDVVMVPTYGTVLVQVAGCLDADAPRALRHVLGVLGEDPVGRVVIDLDLARVPPDAENVEAVLEVARQARARPMVVGAPAELAAAARRRPGTPFPLADAAHLPWLRDLRRNRSGPTASCRCGGAHGRGCGCRSACAAPPDTRQHR